MPLATIAMLPTAIAMLLYFTLIALAVALSLLCHLSFYTLIYLPVTLIFLPVKVILCVLYKNINR